MLWIEEQFCHSKVESLSQDLGLSNLVVNLLLSRGIGSKEEAITFLNPKLAQLSDPLSNPNLENASSRICKAILENEHILIVGDYDVDGISSTVIVQKTLT
jgi:single-stranded-DNA-specific exonuclease